MSQSNIKTMFLGELKVELVDDFKKGLRLMVLFLFIDNKK